MTMLFRDRRDAGRQLAEQLKRLHLTGRVVVLGLPRGGVPVAYEVARALNVPLDVFVVRKLGVPGHEELAMGAVATGGVRVLNSGIVRALQIPHDMIERVTAAEQLELQRREREFRTGRPFPDLHGATVLLVDDGLATGATMVAAVQAVRKHGPGRIIVATPVASESACDALARGADGCECVATPEPFEGVGRWYGDFTQTDDDEVRALLRESSAGGIPGAEAATVAGGGRSYAPQG